jgi:hypothetical protein
VNVAWLKPGQPVGLGLDDDVRVQLSVLHRIDACAAKSWTSSNSSVVKAAGGTQALA